jgi:hypothetical protein
MFLMGLNPAYTPLVYSQNPADLNAAINSARTIEIGYNFATDRMPKIPTQLPVLLPLLLKVLLLVMKLTN